MKVAIVLPCYNSMTYLPQCVETALSQDYDNYEIRAYDNGSDDGTLDYLYELEKKHDTLTVYEVPNIYENSFREAYDHAFENSDADYITSLSSDDFLDHNYLSNCINIFSQNPEKIKCIQSVLVGVNEQGQKVNSMGHSYKSIEEFKTRCMQGSPVTSPSVVYHKSLFPLMNWSPYGGPAHKDSNIREGGAGDYDVFCGFADNNVFNYPVPIHLGYYYRWHPQQCTWKVHEKKKTVNYDKIIQDFWRKKWNL